jgi:hypothetical protein
MKRYVLLLVLLTSEVASASASPLRSSQDDESQERHVWEQVMALKPGTTVWARSEASRALTELVVAKVTEDAIRAAVVSELKQSKASLEQVLPRCADSPNDRLVVSGETIDFTNLCQSLAREEVLEVHAIKKSSPLRSILIGSGITTAIALVPCDVAPQANGSATGCRLGAAATGALVGWAIHGLRPGKRTLIYEAEGPGQEPHHEPRWDDLARDMKTLEDVLRNRRLDSDVWSRRRASRDRARGL